MTGTNAFAKIKTLFDNLVSHKNDKIVHITSEERTKWNNSAIRDFKIIYGEATINITGTGSQSGEISLTVPSGYTAVGVVGFNATITTMVVSRCHYNEDTKKVPFAVRSTASGGISGATFKVTVLCLKKS